uniref:RING-type E3 ubiquitin transferase n=1 Tax=Steinernema glaseri TaxID=37863 RepID=A0A1I8A3X4_9BILA
MSSNDQGSDNTGSRKNENGRGRGKKKPSGQSNESGSSVGRRSAAHPNKARHQLTLTKEQQEALFDKIAATERTTHCGLPFAGAAQECVICCKMSDLFGIGDCRHPVCIECAIRMRVISDQDSCPQCRGTIAVMHFVQAPEGDWCNFSLAAEFLDHPDTVTHNVRFDSEYAKAAYDRYLSHTCRICSKGENSFTVPTFDSLRHHYGQKHRQFFCHICTENLRLFSWERKTYSSEALQMHMKKGDRDDKSFKGHPSCLFCTERFFDTDQQYKHLRKEHFFCQICEADGVTSVFYKEMAELLTHYHKEHYPCNIDECKQMGIVFRSELELNIHTASEHNSNGRPVAVSLDFRFNDRTFGTSNNRVRTRENNTRAANASATEAQSRPSNVPVAPPTIVSEAEQPRIVPSASAAATSSRIIIPSAQNNQRQINTAYAQRSSFNMTSANDFPTLPSEARSASAATRTTKLIPSIAPRVSLTASSSRKPTPMSQPTRQTVSVKTNFNTRKQNNADDDYVFSGRSSPPPPREAKPKITIIPANSVGRNAQPMPMPLNGPINSKLHFPALGGSSAASAKPVVNWGKPQTTAKPSASNQAKKVTKALPKPDLWPDLCGPSGSAGSNASTELSLKDVSLALLRGTDKNGQPPSSTSGPNPGSMEATQSQGGDKKRKKKKNNVTIVNLADLDQRGGRR